MAEYQSAGIEITDHKELERQLQESRDRFRLAVEGTRDGLWDWNLRTDDLWLSPRLKEMLGYSDEELPNDLAASSPAPDAGGSGHGAGTASPPLGRRPAL